MPDLEQQPISVNAGESLVVRRTFVRGGAPQDISAASLIEFQVKRLAGDPDPPLIAKALGAGIAILPQGGADLGAFEITLDPVDTAELVGRLAYDVWLVLAGQRRLVVPASPFVVSAVVNGYP